MADCRVPVPLTPFQSQVLQVLAQNRSAESHLAGGAGIHLSPASPRYTNDVDFFHDREDAVAEAYVRDRATLEFHGIRITEQLNRPGIVRAVVSQATDSTKIEWVYDTAWRFMPVRRDPIAGFVLHPVDLAVNKVLALAGRDEPRDVVDTLFVHRRQLTLGALCWAAAGKDPGFSPSSLVEMLARKGQLRPEETEALRMTRPLDLPRLKEEWLSAIEGARQLVRRLPAEEVGCLYYDPSRRRFVEPGGAIGLISHRGRLGGVLPQVGASSIIEVPEARAVFEEGYELPDGDRGVGV